MTKEEAIMKIRMDICIERYMCDGCQHEECEYWLAMKALDELPSAQHIIDKDKLIKQLHQSEKFNAAVPDWVYGVIERMK